MIKAILFDMDGVLVEAKDWHYEALNRSLALFGMGISRKQHLTTFDGLPTKEKLEILSKEEGLPKGLHSFINEMKQKYTMETVHQKCKPRFIHEQALSFLKSQNYKLAVCSNAIRSSVEVMMTKTKLKGYLDLMISTDDIKKPKPDPEMYIKSFEFFNLKPQECLILEDNENGIKAALASGGILMQIDEIEEVNIENILSEIRKADQK